MLPSRLHPRLPDLVRQKSLAYCSIGHFSLSVSCLCKRGAGRPGPLVRFGHVLLLEKRFVLVIPNSSMTNVHPAHVFVCVRVPSLEYVLCRWFKGAAAPLLHVLAALERRSGDRPIPPSPWNLEYRGSEIPPNGLLQISDFHC